jgi:isoamyl acetate esterase
MIPLRPAIVLLGDSLTQMGWGVDGHVGWVSLLANAYTRRADILNRGYSGYNTRHAVQQLLSRLWNDPPTTPRSSSDASTILFATIWFGANDSALPGQSQHIPIDEYIQNLTTLVQSFQVERKIPVILLTPPPVDEKRWMKYWGRDESREPPDRQLHVTREYCQACRNVAVDQNCLLLDVFDLLGGNNEGNGPEPAFSIHLSDGLHLSESGNTLVYEGLMTLVQNQIPNLAPMGGDGKHETSGIPMQEPLWKDLC